MAAIAAWAVVRFAAKTTVFTFASLALRELASEVFDVSVELRWALSAA
jgi:hypothetical protein